MTKTRKSYEHEVPGLAQLMKYVEACPAWVSVTHLTQEFGLTKEATTMMCRRMVRAGILESRPAKLSKWGTSNEFRATEAAEEAYWGVLDGRIQVGVHPRELGFGHQGGRDLEEEGRPEG